MTSITISKRFCGPPNSGNGGYAAGKIAEQLSFTPEITLKAPVPLEQPMNLIKKLRFSTQKHAHKAHKHINLI